MTNLDPKRPVVRRIGRMAIRLEVDGISIKVVKGRRWRKVPWKAVAKKALELDPPPAGLTQTEWENPLKFLGIAR